MNILHVFFWGASQNKVYFMPTKSSPEGKRSRICCISLLKLNFVHMKWVSRWKNLPIQEATNRKLCRLFLSFSNLEKKIVCCCFGNLTTCQSSGGCLVIGRGERGEGGASFLLWRWLAVAGCRSGIEAHIGSHEVSVEIQKINGVTKANIGEGIV